MCIAIFLTLLFLTGPATGRHLGRLAPTHIIVHTLSGRDPSFKVSCVSQECDFSSPDPSSLSFNFLNQVFIHDPSCSIRDSLLNESNMDINFRCQHKGRSSWDTHTSCVTCRIRNNLLCSHQNSCHYCINWEDRDWASQDIRSGEIGRPD